MRTVQECIDKVNASSGLNSDECHASAEVVVRALSGLGIGPCDGGTLEGLKAECARVAQAGECRVYRVDVGQLGHSFALVQCGQQAVLMQSWVGCYTLQEWMMGISETVKKNLYLPRTGETDHAVFSYYLDIMSKELNARRVDEVSKYALALFNPVAPRTQAMNMAIRFASGNPLAVRWDSRLIQ
jgi:hypothetical protein